MTKTNGKKRQEGRTYKVEDLLTQGEENPTEALLGHNEAYKRMKKLCAEIAASKEEVAGISAILNSVLQNEYMVGAARAFAKKKHIRSAIDFRITEQGDMRLACASIERVVTKRYSHKAETMAQLRQRGKELGVDVDALGMGRSRWKIANFLNDLDERMHGGQAKMVRTGESVPVSVVG